MNFLTPEDVAEMFKVTPEVIIQWLRQGKLPGLKIGNVWRVEESRLEAAITAKLDGNMPPAEPYEAYAEEYMTEAEAPRKRKRGRKPTGKYDGLKAFLTTAKGKKIKLSFREIEAQMNDILPQSAYRLRPWWGNDFSHSQARAWLHAGWETHGVDLDGRIITFVRRT